MLQQAIEEIRRIGASGKQPESWGEFFFGFIVLMLLLGVILTLLERWFPEQMSQPSVLRRPGAKVDYAYWWINHFLDKVAAIGMLFIALAILLLRIPRFESVLSLQPVPLQALEAFVIGDLIGYWTHRSMHEIPWLWRFHAVHHSSTNLDWLAGGRVHPVETVVTKLIPFAAIFCLGFSPAIGIVFGPVVALHAIFLHANVRWDFGALRWIVSSPAFHRWHHAAEPDAINKNYAGLFPFYDRWFGTAYFPEARRPVLFGLLAERDEFPDGLWKQIRYPWRRCGTLIKAQATAKKPMSDVQPPYPSNQA